MSWLSQFTGQDAQSNGADYTKQAAAKQAELYDSNKKLSDTLTPYFNQWAANSQNPLSGVPGMMTDYEDAARKAGFSDPYSSANTELESGAYRDSTADSIAQQVAALNATANQPGVVGNSRIGSAMPSIYANAAQQNAAYARQLRIRAGQERYANYVAARNQQTNNAYRNLDAQGNTANMLMNVRGAMSGNVGGIGTAGANLTNLGQQQMGNVVQLATAAGGMMPSRNAGTSDATGGVNQHGNTSWMTSVPNSQRGNYNNGTQSMNPALFNP